MNIYVHGEDDMKEKLAKAIFLLHRLRVSTKRWNAVYGFDANHSKKRWEEESDNFLEEVKKESRELEQAEKIKIINNGE